MNILNIRRWLLVIVALLCLGINIAAFALYQKQRDAAEAQQWVGHTYEVLTLAGDLFFNIQDMNTAQRGYLITGNPEFITNYNTAVGKVDQELGQIREMTADNTERQAEIERLAAVVAQQRALLDSQIMNKRNGTFVGTRMDASREYMDEIRRLNISINHGERELLRERNMAEEKSRRNYIGAIFASAGVSIAALLAGNIFILILGYRRRMDEENLRRINKEMEGFTYIASHDLRSPLVNLKGFASEMRLGLDELRPLVEKSMENSDEKTRNQAMRIMDDEIPDALNYIHTSVEKMDKLTTAILELSRLGRRSLAIEPLDVAAIVRRCLDTLHHQITMKCVRVDVHPLPPVTADALSVEQVFGNVIDNAIKYLDPERPGHLEIGGFSTYRETTYWVKDNGRGISKSDMEKIFEIYRRAGNNAEIPGEGMGMAYVRTTLRRLGGAIWCESTAGKGTIFYFTISNNLKKEAR